MISYITNLAVLEVCVGSYGPGFTLQQTNFVRNTGTNAPFLIECRVEQFAGTVLSVMMQ
jgi:hypothetical protein